ISGVLLLLFGVSFAGIGGPHAARITIFSSGPPPGGGGGPANLTVNLTDRPSFDPSDLIAPANSVLHLKLVNTGAVDHTFTLSMVPNFLLPSTVTPSELNEFFHANGSIANDTVPAATTVFDNVSLPPTAVNGDSFEFVSVLPYQFQAGMRGFLNISGGALGPGVVVTDNATDSFRFVPDVLAVAPTTFPVTVDVQVSNIGSAPHTWTLAPQSNVTLTPGNFTAYFASHAPMGRVVLQNGGSSNWTNFSVAKPGVYEFLCEISGHFLNGMYGFLYVGVAPPAPVAAPSTEIVQVGLLLGAGSLLGVGIIFAIAASYTGRFPRAPPGSGPGH
ncbi:MAG: hypothetical protein L3K06_04415, partial [Thermoplasmata archaeon]|nr:hypothetical protein [Thermoplasmata archaeon]